ncbi:hypothetical protein Agub_g13843 [Astrephomene gubernaculifera]|uniref:Ribonuclease H1 N-terminal domain-containing protein n=1 Tax=Astrephomene gubernaculifera TaxID=47775 RepID=A0AAD3E0G1_9CHLO|nr:hypothetical protein Agub_g13843 [Astrephomene gubernaculifera]
MSAASTGIAASTGLAHGRCCNGTAQAAPFCGRHATTQLWHSGPSSSQLLGIPSRCLVVSHARRKVYAVVEPAAARGVYRIWSQVRELVEGVSNALHKGFASEAAAFRWIEEQVNLEMKRDAELDDLREQLQNIISPSPETPSSAASATQSEAAAAAEVTDAGPRPYEASATVLEVPSQPSRTYYRKWYAVRFVDGGYPGVYGNWEEAQAAIRGRYAEHRSFDTYAKAVTYAFGQEYAEQMCGQAVQQQQQQTPQQQYEQQHLPQQQLAHQQPTDLSPGAATTDIHDAYAMPAAAQPHHSAVEQHHGQHHPEPQYGNNTYDSNTYDIHNHHHHTTQYGHQQQQHTYRAPEQYPESSGSEGSSSWAVGTTVSPSTHHSQQAESLEPSAPSFWPTMLLPWQQQHHPPPAAPQFALAAGAVAPVDLQQVWNPGWNAGARSSSNSGGGRGRSGVTSRPPLLPAAPLMTAPMPPSAQPASPPARVRPGSGHAWSAGVSGQQQQQPALHLDASSPHDPQQASHESCHQPTRGHQPQQQQQQQQGQSCSVPSDNGAAALPPDAPVGPSAASAAPSGPSPPPARRPRGRPRKQPAPAPSEPPGLPDSSSAAAATSASAPVAAAAGAAVALAPAAVAASTRAADPVSPAKRRRGRPRKSDVQAAAATVAAAATTESAPAVTSLPPAVQVPYSLESPHPGSRADPDLPSTRVRAVEQQAEARRRRRQATRAEQQAAEERQHLQEPLQLQELESSQQQQADAGVGCGTGEGRAAPPVASSGSDSSNTTPAVAVPAAAATVTAGSALACGGAQVARAKSAAARKRVLARAAPVRAPSPKTACAPSAAAAAPSSAAASQGSSKGGGRRSKGTGAGAVSANNTGKPKVSGPPTAPTGSAVPLSALDPRSLVRELMARRLCRRQPEQPQQQQDEQGQQGRRPQVERDERQEQPRRRQQQQQ